MLDLYAFYLKKKTRFLVDISTTSDIFFRASPKTQLLTVDIQRDTGLQHMTLGHGTIPDDAFVLGAIVGPSGNNLQGGVGIVVLRTALERIRLQRYCAALPVPAAKNTQVIATI